MVWPVGDSVQLQPKHPPGLKRHKVRAYSVEIHRLQADGYTYDEIREALADAGVVVSRSTVQREGARVMRRLNPTSATAAAAVATPPPAATPVHREAVRSAALPHAGDPRTSQQIAEDFMKDQVTNPLLRPERTS
jgi:hypothetical protein